jgi:hypothetical protein
MNISVSNATPTLIFTKDYPKFKLMPYSCANAHGTVRVESFNSGYIEGGFDYRNMIILNPYPTGVSIKGIEGWIQQIRYYGKLSISAIPVETDNIFDGYRNLKQVQTQIKNEYNLRIDFIKTDLSEQIIYDNLLADYILLNDYNANNVKDYREVKVSLLSVDPPESFKNRTNLFNIKFVDYLQNLLKRHY